jgi:hypothetical protein
MREITNRRALVLAFLAAIVLGVLGGWLGYVVLGVQGS